MVTKWSRQHKITPHNVNKYNAIENEKNRRKQPLSIGITNAMEVLNSILLSRVSSVRIAPGAPFEI